MKYRLKQKVMVKQGFYKGTIGAVVECSEQVPYFWQFWKKKRIAYVVMPRIEEKDLSALEEGQTLVLPGPFAVWEEDLTPIQEVENTDNVRSLL